MKINNNIWTLAIAIAASTGSYAQSTNKGEAEEMNKVDIGFDKEQTTLESTSATSQVSGDRLKERSGFTSSSNLFGYLPGLTSLEKTSTSTTFYVRGQHSLSGSTPLVLVDGIERSMDYVMPEEIEKVTILKDAAAVALYGYKGANGAIVVTTKRGKYNSREITVTLDHKFNFQVRRPKFVDAYTYASAYNEALGYEGSSPMYNSYALEAFRTGSNPYLFPNVDWADETFKKSASTNLYNISFRGGGQKFRYYALANLEVDKGFIKNPNENDGYSTQDKNVRGNLRMNLDIDLTNRTKLVANVYGTLAESGQPGSSNIWSLIYNLPSAAIPVKTEDGLWGGSNTWSGTKNPVAQSQAAAYTKAHTRAMFADITLKQDFGAILEGLGGSARLAYDNRAQYVEDHTKTYNYGSDAVATWDDNGQPLTYSRYEKLNNESAMGKNSYVKSYNRVFNFIGTINYDRTFGNHSVYSQLRWDYEYRNTGTHSGSSDSNKSTSTSTYRQDISWYTHYGFKSRYYADLALTWSASNSLAPGTKWALSPTLSAAWIISGEKFMESAKAIDLLKLRASAGIINTDNNPGGPYWQTVYSSATGGSYAFSSSYSKLDAGNTHMSAMAVIDPTHEKAYKYNVGIDLGLWKSLNFTFDAYYERRTDIWVSSTGKYSDVLGLAAPKENAGKVNSWGYDLGLDYTKQLGEVKVNAGLNFSFNRTKVVNQNEEPQAYANTSTTGLPLNQIMGYEAIGFFKDQADIDNSPEQTFATVYPGDIKYRDVNGDNKIDENDKVAIGYNSTCPEIYYSFNLGAEWRGLGFNMMFQGVGNYSEVLSASGFYRPLLAKTSLSQYYYDNRWTPDNQNALFPRLATASSKNNYQTSTLWLRDASFLKLRNVEVYYKLPKSLLEKTKIVNTAKLYVRGIDLLCFDDIKESDPESTGATDPLNRSLVLGLQVTF